MVSTILRKYNLDCREVARGTQSVFSCLCTYSTYDMRCLAAELLVDFLQKAKT